MDQWRFQMIQRSLLLMVFVLLFSIGDVPISLAATNDPSSFISDLGGRALASMPNGNTAAVR
jgi:hypothetical protein